MSSLQRRSSRAVRQRRLAGDRRSGTFPRRIARRAQYDYLRSISGELVLLGLAVAALLAAVIWFIPSEFLRGLVAGAVTIGVTMSVWSFVVLATGTAPKMMGDLGEQWTASELRKLRRQGWFTVNHVLLLAAKDIDHVVVGPGGVLAVETKWTAYAWEGLSDERIRAAATTAREHATRLSNWQDLKSLGLGRATPVVVLWGSGAKDLPPVGETDGVIVVAGPHAATWRRQLPSRGITSDRVNAAWDVLEAQCRRRDERDGVTVPPSPLEWVTQLFLAVLAGCLSFALVAQVVAWSQSLWAGLVCLTLTAASGVLALRWSATRLVATGWLTGAAGIAVFGLVAVALNAGRSI